MLRTFEAELAHLLGDVIRVAPVLSGLLEDLHRLAGHLELLLQDGYDGISCLLQASLAVLHSNTVVCTHVAAV